MKGIIKFNVAKKKYELTTADQKKVVARSKNVPYLEAIVSQQRHPRVLKHQITETKLLAGPAITVTDPQDHPVAPTSAFTIDERFEFSEELIGMVINKTAKSVLITGEGGVGKTYTVLDVLKKHGKVDVRTTMPSIEDFDPIGPDDDEETMEEKALSLITRPKGDYIMIKGYSTAKALYRTLFENRTRTILFDDCDSVLKDPTASQLLKSALDSYEERWISWNAEIAGESDLPRTFRFQGSIIFVSNMQLSKVDEAIRTRCFKVDVSMTKAQRIERMYTVLENVMPDVDLMDKLEALNLMERNLAIAKEVNFRALMNIISIRVDPAVKDWKKLATFALTEY